MQWFETHLLSNPFNLYIFKLVSFKSYLSDEMVTGSWCPVSQETLRPLPLNIWDYFSVPTPQLSSSVDVTLICLAYKDGKHVFAEYQVALEPVYLPFCSLATCKLYSPIQINGNDCHW